MAHPRVEHAVGCNDAGQCGVESSAKACEKPTRVAIPDEYKVVDMSVGLGRSMFKCSPRKSSLMHFLAN